MKETARKPVYTDFLTVSLFSILEAKRSTASLILSKPDETLANYIKLNIDIYFDIMVEDCSESFHDDENVIKYILGNESLNDKQKYCSPFTI